MDSTELKHRKTDDTEPPPSAVSTADDGGSPKKSKNKSIAKQGLKSLALSISIPLSLTLLTIALSSNPKNQYHHPSATGVLLWVPSAKVVNFGSLASSLLLGVSAWLVWAQGGFHARPNALYLYGSYLVLAMAWYALVLGAGALRVGCVVGLAKTAALVGCERLFRGVNPIAGDLIRGCLVWSVFVTVVSIAMVSL